MKLNLVLVAVALACLGLVTYRMGIIKLDRKFYLDLAPNIALALLFLVLLWRTGGATLAAEGAKRSFVVTMGFLPLLLVLFWAVGQAMVFVDLHRTAVLEFMSGKYGLPGSFIAGMVMPSSLSGLPIVKDLWEDGGDKLVLLNFVIASSCVGLVTILFRATMLGWKISIIYFLCAMLMAVQATLALHLLRKVL